ncbi:MAG: sensor histidine kinase [Planctomycetota bacterium]|jgi:signal transduction histidine kinase
MKLTWKFALLLLLILGGLGLVSLLLSLRTARLHAQQVSQQLNRDVAQHIAKDLRPFADGGVDEQALKSLFMDVMRINPSLEVYLLDESGVILMFDAPPEKVVRRHVDLAPVRRFLASDGKEVVTGDDPRSADRSKVFTAWPVQSGGRPAGYLYIVVGGEEYDSIAGLIEASYVHRASFWVAAVSLVVAGLAGVAAFVFLTRPIDRLRRVITRFEGGDGAARLQRLTADEIGELGAAFNRMADRIVEQIGLIRRNDERRCELIASISHDLRTPIANMQGFLETKLIKEQGLSREEHVRYTELALRNARQLSQLVDHLFELARLDAGEVVPRPECFSIRELVQDVVQEMGLAARKKGIDLQVRAPAGLPDVQADIGLMQRVIMNLLSNSIRYTAEGGHVRVSLARREDGVELGVTDNGPGIPQTELPHVFDAFYRVEKSRNEDGGGTGLGLAIAKRILDLHGCRIRVKSREQVGTRIAFTLAS